jgi:hypothetical protein
VVVRPGARVRAGAALGAAGPAGRVRLGARLRGRRFGYVDPLRLLGPDRPAPPPVAPLGRAPRPGSAPTARRPAARPVVRVAVPRPADAPAPAIPPAAWAGLVLLAAGVPLGGLVRRGRRRRPAPIVSGRWFASSRSSRP